MFEYLDMSESDFLSSIISIDEQIPGTTRCHQDFAQLEQRRIAGR